MTAVVLAVSLVLTPAPLADHPIPKGETWLTRSADSVMVADSQLLTESFVVESRTEPKPSSFVAVPATPLATPSTSTATTSPATTNRYAATPPFLTPAESSPIWRVPWQTSPPASTADTAERGISLWLPEMEQLSATPAPIVTPATVDGTVPEPPPPPPTPPPSPRQLVDEIFGWPGPQLVTCESGWDQSAVGRYGERGLFQVHPIWRAEVERHGWTWQQMFEVEPNIRMAAHIRRVQGLRAWTCWRG